MSGLHDRGIDAGSLDMGISRGVSYLFPSSASVERGRQVCLSRMEGLPGGCPCLCHVLLCVSGWVSCTGSEPC